MRHKTLPILLFCFSLLAYSRIQAQLSIQLSPIEKKASWTAPDRQFKQWKAVQLEAKNLLSYFQKHEIANLEITLPKGPEWSLVAEKTRLTGPTYTLQVASEKGTEIKQGKPSCITLKAYPQQWQEDAEARITLDKNFFYAYFRKGKEYYYIEPLSYYLPSAPPNAYISYKASDVIPVEGKTCGLQEVHKKKKEIISGDLYKTGNCYEVELAIASDGLMFQKYGSVTAVENHNIAVMNNVAGNWDDEFADEIQFIIVEQYVSTSPAADPWTSSTDANA
ncbi:MAG TPA: hypothetical protein ENJ88_01650, partial [Phaeodactylibacter sp.]|nr:hypothetical protein [Phaeodactylibacter sp.]